MVCPSYENNSFICVRLLKFDADYRMPQFRMNRIDSSHEIEYDRPLEHKYSGEQIEWRARECVCVCGMCVCVCCSVLSMGLCVFF